MAISLGVNNIAQNIKRLYIGVNGTAKKIKKAYIGVNGVAQLVYEAGNNIEKLSNVSANNYPQYTYVYATTSTEDYFLIANVSKILAYNSSLTATEISYAGTRIGANYGAEYQVIEDINGAGSVGNYALFYGFYWENDDGETSNLYSTQEVLVFDNSLTHINNNLSCPEYERFATTTLGSYLLNAGGRRTTDTGNTRPDAIWYYNSSLTQATLSKSLQYGRQDLGATTVGSYALFAGGRNDSYSPDRFYSYADTVNTSLTVGTATNLSVRREDNKGLSVGNYALFAGGRSINGDTDETFYTDTVETYNSSLTKGTAENLSFTGGAPIGTDVNNHAFFNYSTAIDIYDSSLSKTIGTPLTYGAVNSGTFKDWAVFFNRTSIERYEIY